MGCGASRQAPLDLQFDVELGTTGRTTEVCISPQRTVGDVKEAVATAALAANVPAPFRLFLAPRELDKDLTPPIELRDDSETLEFAGVVRCCVLRIAGPEGYGGGDAGGEVEGD